MTVVSNGKVMINSNSVNLSPTTGKRQSIRLESMKKFNSGSLFILDVLHLPTGLTTWPAFWLCGPNWPHGGEIDIIEGINLSNVNHATLHTDANCSMTNLPLNQTGKLSFDDCDSLNAKNGNRGCGVEFVEPNNYGSLFNSNKGGVYATEWTNYSIKVWFFPRNNIPNDILKGFPEPSLWMKPSASFPLESNCNANHFGNQTIIINTDFCGDWAGSAFTGGINACNSYVTNNPSAFGESFWEINSLKVYSSLPIFSNQ